MTSKTDTHTQQENASGILDDLRKAQGRALDEAATYVEASMKMSSAMIEVSQELALNATRRALDLARKNLNESAEKAR